MIFIFQNRPFYQKIKPLLNLLGLLFLFVFLFSEVPQVSAQKQNNDPQLAYRFYQEGRYLKAASLYQSLYNKNASRYYFNFLLKCYMNSDEYELARKAIKKEIRKSKDPYFKVKLASVYKKEGQKEKAEKLFKKAIQKISTRYEASNAANGLIEDSEFSYAEKAYLKGRKISKKSTDFATELSRVYLYMRDYKKAINEYFILLEHRPSYLKYVENRLQNIMNLQNNSDFAQQLKPLLIEKIQNSSETVFNELLIWLYIQEKNFRQAYRQTIALDKRLDEKGKRLIALGQLAYKNADYTNAVNCYDYICKMASSSPYYEQANWGLMQSKEKLVIQTKPVDTQALDELLRLYKKTIKTKHRNQEILMKLNINYAHLLGFYKQQTDSAIHVLEEIKDKPRNKPYLRSEILLELADLLLLNNDIWEATLYYSQVIKANPNNEIGHKAQIQKAKLSYYSGDFLWAKAQLDILKAATTKLIANDALYLSQLISDNQTDSSNTALALFSKADLYLFQNKKDSALLLLDSLKNMETAKELQDDILFKQAQIYQLKNELDKAKALYKTITEQYYDAILADNALYEWANILFNNNEKELAVEMFTKLLVDFPNSLLASKARQKIVAFRDS